VLIGTLTRFFSFAVDFDFKIHSINKTTHTSFYTYWFLVLSAQILSKCSLSKEIQARHTYLLAVIATRLDGVKASDYYLFLMASIYASIISRSSVICSSPFWGNFLRAVMRHRDNLKDNLTDQQLLLCKAVKANEVIWDNIYHALEALGALDIASVPRFPEANDKKAGRRALSSDRDLLSSEGRESGERSRDHGERLPLFEWFMFNYVMQPRKAVVHIPERVYPSAHPGKRTIPLNLEQSWMTKAIRESRDHYRPRRHMKG
jgi:hypothetical protein